MKPKARDMHSQPWDMNCIPWGAHVPMARTRAPLWLSKLQWNSQQCGAHVLTIEHAPHNHCQIMSYVWWQKRQCTPDHCKCMSTTVGHDLLNSRTWYVNNIYRLLWSTALDFHRWLRHMHGNSLLIASVRRIMTLRMASACIDGPPTTHTMTITYDRTRASC